MYFKYFTTLNILVYQKWHVNGKCESSTECNSRKRFHHV